MTVFHEYQTICSSSEKELFDWLESQVEKPFVNEFIDKTEDLDNDEDLTCWIKRRPSGKRSLQLTGYVGTVPVDARSFIEILPKVRLGSANSDAEDKQKLVEMVCALMEEVSHIPFGDDTIHVQEQATIFEKLIELFLKDVLKLVQYGLACHYVQVEENIPYLKGKILFGEQLRKNMGLSHRFYTQHDEFLPDRLENRIIKLALLTVRRYSKNKGHLRLINKLLTPFSMVSSQIHTSDLKNTYCDREMRYYRKVLKWAEIILMNMSPLLFRTETHELKLPSLLFPMYRLFEAHVYKQLKQKYGGDLIFYSQDRSKKLFEQIDSGVKIKNPTLRPDVVVKQHGKVVAVMDTKWKVLSSKNLKFSSSDLYQMYVYGKKFFTNQSGSIFLIYPKNPSFKKLLGPFVFESSPHLKLFVAPFDFDKNDLILSSYELKSLILTNSRLEFSVDCGQIP